jgi:hypothetical protein
MVPSRARLECEEKRGALSGRRFGPYLATVPVNDPLYRGQADPRAGKVLLPVKPLKDSEQLIGILGIEAHSVVPHHEGFSLFGIAGSDFNDSGLAVLGKLHGVREKINQN